MSKVKLRWRFEVVPHQKLVKSNHSQKLADNSVDEAAKFIASALMANLDILADAIEAEGSVHEFLLSYSNVIESSIRKSLSHWSDESEGGEGEPFLNLGLSSSDKILSKNEVLEALTISKSTLHNWLKESSPYYKSNFPKQVKLGVRRVGWRESDINKFIKSLTKNREV